MCELKGARHGGEEGGGGNHIYYLVHLASGQYSQRCYADCDQRRAVWHNFPPRAMVLAEAFVDALDAADEAAKAMAPAPPAAAAAAPSATKRAVGSTFARALLAGAKRQAM